VGVGDGAPLHSGLVDRGSEIGDVRATHCPSASGATAMAAGPLSGITQALDDIHVKLPFLENPGKMLGILFGQDVDLILW